jgi:oxygen-independent coproporphyrinogen III oxidase
MSPASWRANINEAYNLTGRDKGIGLYIHLPFCESLCTYCGCNTRITKNHDVERPYADLIEAEWDIYLKWFGERPLISELHLGGGTPTFFSPSNLFDLVRGVLNKAIMHSEFEGAFEGHPNNTTLEHLEALARLGFKRVSFGVQDNDLRVQQIINRIQPWENVERVTKWARQAGFESVNFDLVYGLPLQTSESVRDTVSRTIELRPERIAYYSYAHVPWIKKGQRKYTEADLPEGSAKRELYETGKQMLLEAGYVEIGLDHFALPGDALHDAMILGTLQRNFMGYTTSRSEVLIGLGVSAISDAGTAFFQNPKTLEAYTDDISAGKLIPERSHELTSEDMRVRNCISDVMCKDNTSLQPLGFTESYWRREFSELISDRLIELNGHMLTVLPAGRPFLRNICMVMDLRLKEMKSRDGDMFSKTA